MKIKFNHIQDRQHQYQKNRNRANCSYNNKNNNNRESPIILRRGGALISQRHSVVMDFWIGASSCLCNYWKYVLLLTFLHRFTWNLIEGEKTSRFVAKPIVLLFASASQWGRWRYVTIFVTGVIKWISTKLMCAVVAAGGDGLDYDKWYQLVYCIVGAPIVEGVVFRLCTSQFLKYTFQKVFRSRSSASSPTYNNIKDEDEEETKKNKKKKRAEQGTGEQLQSKPSIIFPWSTITSILFALIRVDPYEDFTSFCSDSLAGRSRLARISYPFFLTFCFSLFRYCPLYEKYGVFAAIGAHAAWNSVAFFPGLRTAVLDIRFVYLYLAYRCFWENTWNIAEHSLAITFATLSREGKI